MAKISKKEIEHLANLARLALTAQEKKIFQDQIPAILDYIDQLKKVNTKAQPISNISGLENIVRDDDSGNVNLEVSKDDLLKNAPETEGDFIKVPQVLNIEE